MIDQLKEFNPNQTKKEAHQQTPVQDKSLEIEEKQDEFETDTHHSTSKTKKKEVEEMETEPQHW